MYIRTKHNLVNLRDKDIRIRAGYGFGGEPTPYLVLAEGPAAGFDHLNEAYIQTQIELFKGTEKDCLHYLNGLCRDMADTGSVIVDGDFESLTGYSPVKPDKSDHITAVYAPGDKCESCGDLLGDSLVCDSCGHDNIPF